MVSKFLVSACLVLLSAVLLVLPFHFSWFWFLAYFAFIPYFFALRDRTLNECLKLSYLFGALFFIFLGFWLTFVSVPGFILMVLYLALYFAAFGFVVSYFLNPANPFDWANPQKSVMTALIIPAFWVVLEYLRGWVISGIPWALLAHCQWKNLPVIQIADLTGVYGVSYFLMLVNWALFKILQLFFFQKTKEDDLTDLVVNRRKFLTAMGTLLIAASILVIGYGALSLKSWGDFYRGPQPKAVIRVSVVQGNIPQDQKWNAKIKNIIFEKYRRLTFMSAIERSDLIVWPETSFPGYLEDEPVMAAELRRMIRQTRTEVLVGAPSMGNLEQGLRFYNSAILYNSEGEEKKRYNKLHLVPFGEFVPFEPWLGVIRKFAEIGHFSAGKETTVFDTQTRYQKTNIKAKFAVLICYEDIFPGLVRSFCRNGADFLINVTNDAWFGDTTAPYQHAQASVFRAVENRVNVVRATNTGFSCFISPEGRILSRVEDNGKEIFVTGHKGHDLILRKRRSFYTRFGDWFILLAFFLCVLAYREKMRQNPYARL